jgi:hypothetical protein
MTQALTVQTTTLGETMQLGELLAASGFFQDSRGAAQAVVKVLAGREIGFGPIASMTGINVIQGRVSISANLMAAAIKRSGRYDYRVKEMTPQRCEIEFRERNGDKWEIIGSSEFTAQDARQAGTKNMDKFARNMLFARAMSNGARWYCPDIFGGSVYTPEEMGATVDGETGEVIDAPAPRVITTEQPKPAPAANGQQAQAKPQPAADGDLPFRDQGTAVLWAAKFAHYQKPDGSPDYGHITGSIRQACKEHGCRENDVKCWGPPWHQHVVGKTLDAQAAAESGDVVDMDPVTEGDWLDG